MKCAHVWSHTVSIVFFFDFFIFNLWDLEFGTHGKGASARLATPHQNARRSKRTMIKTRDGRVNPKKRVCERSPAGMLLYSTLSF